MITATTAIGNPISKPYIEAIFGINNRGRVLGLTVKLIIGPDREMFWPPAGVENIEKVRFWPDEESLPEAPSSQSLSMYTLT